MAQSPSVAPAISPAIAPGDPLKVLTLVLQGETFAVEAGLVREILDLVPVTRVPGARAFVDGLVNVRGKVVPLADLRVAFGMAVGPATIDTRIVVVEIALDGEPTLVGLVADTVREVAEIAAASLEPPPRVGMRWRADYVRGIAKHDGGFVVLPDLNRVLAAPTA